MAIYNLSISTGLGLQPVQSSHISPIVLSVSARLTLHPGATVQALRTYPLTVSASIGLQPAATLQVFKVYSLTVSASVGLRPQITLAAYRVRNLTVSASLGLRPSPTLQALRIYSLTVSASVNLRPLPLLTALRSYRLSVSASLGLRPGLVPNYTKQFSVTVGLGLRPSASLAAIRSLSVTASLRLQPSVLSPRAFVLSVSTSLGLRPAPTPAGIGPLYGTVLTTLNLSVSVASTKGGLDLSVGLGLESSVSCVAVVAPGVGMPGATSLGGPSIPLLSGLSGTYPFTFAELPSGSVLLANGIDPMLAWDAMSGQADEAGLRPPTSAPTLSASGLGTITGARYAFIRFLDRNGNPSSLSPLGAPVQCGHDQSIDDITLDAVSGLVTITALDHGLISGQTILIRGVIGLPLSGQYAITSTGKDRISLNNVRLASGSWLGGGSIVHGAASLTYQDIPVSSQSKVSTFQLLRNLEGNLDALFVDGTLNVGATSYSSTLSDEDLARQEAVPLRSEEGIPLAVRQAPPPSCRPFIVNYMGRIFAAGDAVYFAGCVATTHGSAIIQGIGTQWTGTLAGRSIYVRGASRSYGIQSVDTSAQTLTIDPSYTDSSSSFQTYVIRSSVPDRKVLQWSEADNPEAWPPWNALAIPEDNDEIVGLFVRGTFLFVVERRHLWRFQFADDPRTSGHLFLQAERGAINGRVVAMVDDGVYALDESGIHRFDGSGVEPVSQEIQAIFHADGLAPTLQIDWTRDQTLWHASVDPVRTTIRWFVDVVGIADSLTMALCYNYRLKCWWWDRYPVRVTSSTTASLMEVANVGIPGGRRRALAGSECRVILVLGEGTRDLAGGEGTLRGLVTSATTTGFTDDAANFDPTLGGAPISIVRGTGMGQTRLISSASGQSLAVIKPWSIIPDTTSIYQIGGIPWEWRSGWLDLEIMETHTTTDLILVYQGLSDQAHMTVRLYYDHASTPDGYALDTDRDGVTTRAGSTDLDIDMSDSTVIPGYRYHRMARQGAEYGYGARFVQVELLGTTNDEVVRVYQVSLRGVDQEGL